MKKALALFAQVVLFILFVAVFLVGTLLHPLHLRWFISHPSPRATRFFVPDGLILTSVLYLVIVAIEAAARRLRSAGIWTTLAFVLALVVGWIAHFGWATHLI